MTQKAVILLSGGIDSHTCLAIASHEHMACYALAVDYGQKHVSELKAAEKIAKNYQCQDFRLTQLKLGTMSGAALVDDNEPVPEFSTEKSVKSTYFPARNTIFLSMAMAYAESIQAEKIYFGANLADYHGFPDARPEYFYAFNQMASLATNVAQTRQPSIQVVTPLLHLDKASIIEKGIELGVDYSLSITCYQASATGAACGRCDSCVIRLNAFKSLGLSDPGKYS